MPPLHHNKEQRLLPGCGADNNHKSNVSVIISSNTSLTADKSRSQPQEALTCTAADAEVAAAEASSVSATASTKPAAAALLAVGERGQPPAQINKCAGGEAVAAADDDDDNATATPAPTPAGRHAAT
eukprot:6182223-Pleurochrysis_carterae.AAC.2